jgi:hypothetical protein
VIAVAVLFIVMHQRKRETEAVAEESGSDICFVETMIAFKPSDQYVSQENMDQTRLSFGVE